MASGCASGATSKGATVTPSVRFSGDVAGLHSYSTFALSLIAFENHSVGTGISADGDDGDSIASNRCASGFNSRIRPSGRLTSTPQGSLSNTWVRKARARVF